MENPKHLRKAERKLKRLQRAVSRKKNGFANRKKAVQKLALQHQKTANTRKDFQRKVTTKLIRENPGGEPQSISMEKLQIKNMLANHSLAKAISDAGWYQTG